MLTVKVLRKREPKMLMVSRLSYVSYDYCLIICYYQVSRIMGLPDLEVRKLTSSL